jgi:phenylpyruvate tautomerase PptA (4-oxalocrotonate tautomerase family)
LEILYGKENHMTIIRAGVAGMRLDPPVKANLAKRLITEFAGVEVGHFSEPVAAGFTVQIDEIAPDSLWIGLKPAVEIHKSGKAVIISAQVMAGPWNAAMKEELFARLDAGVREVLEIPPGGSGFNVWITITEIEEGSFGVGGKPVSIARLAPFFTSDRQQRITKYLEQKKSRHERGYEA